MQRGMKICMPWMQSLCAKAKQKPLRKHIHTVFASGAATSNDPDIGMGDVRMPQVSLQKLVKVLWRKSN